MNAATFQNFFCDRKETLLLYSHEILNYNLQIIFNFIKVFLLFIWNLHSLSDPSMVTLTKYLSPNFHFTQRPRIQRLKTTEFILVSQCDTVSYTCPCPSSTFLFFQGLRKAYRSFNVTKHTKAQRDGKVLDTILLFSELLEEMQVKMTSNTVSKTQLIIKAYLKIDHMMLFWLIATDIIMDTVFV